MHFIRKNLIQSFSDTNQQTKKTKNIPSTPKVGQNKTPKKIGYIAVNPSKKG